MRIMSLTMTYAFDHQHRCAFRIAVAYFVYMRKAVSTDELAAKYSGVYNFC